jgi:SAM-dependent methyltransferase
MVACSRSIVADSGPLEITPARPGSFRSVLFVMTQSARTAPAIHAGIALLAGSVLLLEVALTRVFAITLWHHFAYMVISIALLGFGAAGSVLTVQRQGLRDDPPFLAITSTSVAYGFGVMLMFVVATRLPIDTLRLLSEKQNLLWMLLLDAVVFVPFLLAGAAIGLVLTRFPQSINRLYFADLSGSAIGGAISLWLLSSIGSGATVIVAGGLGVVAGWLFSLAGKRAVTLALIPAVAIALALCVAFAGGSGTLHIPAIDWLLPYAPGKEFARMPDNSSAVRLFSSTAEVEVGPRVVAIPIQGGNFGKIDYRLVDARIVAQDGTAPTMLFRGAAQIGDFGFLDDSQAGSAYVALAATKRNPDPRVLVIGVGGGIDVMIALANGAREVTAVELNDAMISMVTERFDDYLGGLFRRGTGGPGDRINLVRSEGRSFVKSADERFDVIQMSGVDSFTALNTGAYTLSESYLYTVEAVQDFYRHLRDGGYVSYSRFLLTAPRKPRETLRLANIAFTALQQLGVSDPASQIAVFEGRDWASTMIKRGPFTQAEIEALDRFADREGFMGLVFNPLAAPGSDLSYGPGGKPAPPGVIEARRYFRALLRGTEAERARFIADYPYDVTPSTDDAPFFFNYYRYGGLLHGMGSDARSGQLNLYHADFPVGHAVLLASCVQITFLAVLLILLPLRWLERSGVPTPGRWNILAYFAALGAGFMFVEIVLMQKLVLFLGHPSYATSVVLSSLLAFAGLGSLVGGRMTVSPRSVAILGTCVVAILLVVAGTVHGLIDAFLGVAFHGRVAIVVAALAPLGFVLGIPFPTGIRIVSERCPQLLPWAWAVNALLSVFSSIFCIVLSMGIGFSAALVVAGLVYAGGFAAMLGWVAQPAEVVELSASAQ